MSSADTSAAFADTPVEAADAAAAPSAWVETALTIMFTATAVLVVSFLAVVTGLV
jgi:hypothetical protein